MHYTPGIYIHGTAGGGESYAYRLTLTFMSANRQSATMERDHRLESNGP